MVRSTVRALAGIATTMGIAMMCVSFLAPFGIGQTAPTCGLSGDFVIDLFDGTAMRSDLDEFAATNGPFSTNLPAGRYSIRLQSFDRHSTDSAPGEPAEAWFVRGLAADGGVIWESAAIDDLPDDVDAFSQMVDPGTDIPELFEVVAVHAAFPTESASNTVQAICASFTIQAPANTTTTRPPAITSPLTTTAVTSGLQTGAQGGGSGTDTSDDAGDIGVLGSQIGGDRLPFTGPHDVAWAIAAGGLTAVGAALLLAVRDDRPHASRTRLWR
ncbi:MAG: hypothetical protein OEM97_07935 [Acidimicrobiia bacterium]|nr:hypothetical protein [Acidimicrobiia bacterium]